MGLILCNVIVMKYIKTNFLILFHYVYVYLRVYLFNFYDLAKPIVVIYLLICYRHNLIEN
jgi:hypothetical protein